MAWTKTSEGLEGQKLLVGKEETVTLPSSATTEYSSEIDFIAADLKNNNRYVTFGIIASAVTGTNLDIGLYGSMTSGGTKFLLLDAVVADVTNAAKVKFQAVDLNAYPAPYYYLGWTSDGDESANTVSAYVIA
jgi:hypothetical protein